MSCNAVSVFSVVLTVLVWNATPCACSGSAEVENERVVVKTQQGYIAGQRDTVDGHTVYRYAGVPFAEPPLGNLRFQRPLSVKPWKGVLNATSYAPSCMQMPLQVDENVYLDYGKHSEDCLYLNIWQPAGARACSKDSASTECRLRPVVIYLYGGGFLTGDASFFIFRGDRFAAIADVVYVTVNYRVGMFGFFKTNLPEYKGNAGMFDQVEAMKWVKENAKAFGGDPEEITIWGQSAGAVSVTYHMISPVSRGLFKRAYLQSGAPGSALALMKLNTPAVAHRAMGLLGCYKPAIPWKQQAQESMKCIQSVDAKELLEKTARELPLTSFLFLPTFGDEFLPADPLAEGQQIKTGKELLLSTTPDEGSLFVKAMLLRNPHLRELISEDYKTPIKILMRLLLDVPSYKTESLADVYLKGMDKGDINETEWKMNLGRMFTDALFECAADSFALTASKKGHDVYRFLFAHKPTFSIWEDWMGITHGDDIIFTAGTSADLTRSIKMYGRYPGDHSIALPEPTEDEMEFSRDLVRTIGSFARYGKPKIPKSDMEWPKYTKENKAYVILKPNDYSVAYGPRSKKCHLWEPYLVKRQQSPTTPAPKHKPTPKRIPEKRPGKPLRPLDNFVESSASTGPLSSATALASMLFAIALNRS
ncbi:acetylcholinesterase isoform X3 [Dermacentor silvarum]|nr:acetylcholinesterase isoform X3 [Dermacentor silvarum]